MAFFHASKLIVRLLLAAAWTALRATACVRATAGRAGRLAGRRRRVMGVGLGISALLEIVGREHGLEVIDVLVEAVDLGAARAGATSELGPVPLGERVERPAVLPR